MRKVKNYGTGSVYQPTYKDATGKLKKSKRYWLQFWRDGKRFREPTSTTSYTEAVGQLRIRLSGATPDAAAGGSLTIDKLIELVETDYQREKRRSLPSLKRSRFPHLKKRLAGLDLANVDAVTLRMYRDARLSEKAANGTVNREVAVVLRGLKLAAEAGFKVTIPVIKKLKESAARRGFFEWEEFQAILAKIDPWWHELYTVAYVTGWRIDSEICQMQWSQVDFANRLLRLEPGTTKNDDGRNFPFTERLETALKAQRDRVRTMEKEQNRIITWVFPRKHHLAPLTSAYKPFKKAAIAAGFPARLQHDFRRTAARTLEQAGVPRQTAKKLIGHRTDEMYERYNIVDQRMVDIGRDKLDAYDKLMDAKRADEKSKSA